MPPGAVPPGIWTNGTTLRSAITRYGSRTAAVFANSTCCIGTGGIFLRQLDRGPLVVGCQSASGWRRRLLEYYLDYTKKTEVLLHVRTSCVVALAHRPTDRRPGKSHPAPCDFSPARLRSHAPSDCFRPTTGDRTHPDERNLRSHTLHESRTINHPRPRSRTPPYISSSPSPLLALGEHRRVAPATASSTRRHQVILEPLLLCSSTIFFLLIFIANCLLIIKPPLPLVPIYCN